MMSVVLVSRSFSNALTSRDHVFSALWPLYVLRAKVDVDLPFIATVNVSYAYVIMLPHAGRVTKSGR